jgi:hypothetical protein
LKEKQLTEAGYNLKIIWEHEIDDQLLKNLTMNKFFNDETLWNFLNDPITSAREAYYGKNIFFFFIFKNKK